jgi:fucose 4-O-acetylase-like acetyltransferase
MDRSNSGSKRIEYIDRLKGFAIVLVVLGHVTDGYFFGRFDPGSDDIFWTICNIIYSFHMPAFMAVSGYVAYRPGRPVGGRRKIKRHSCRNYTTNSVRNN